MTSHNSRSTAISRSEFGIASAGFEYNPRLNMVFGAGFANLMANPLGGNNNNGRETNTATACTLAAGGVVVTKTQGGSKDKADYQPDFEEDHSGLNRQDQPTERQQGGLSILREDWLNPRCFPDTSDCHTRHRCRDARQRTIKC